MLISAEIQMHGYRKGHQLLASSVTLSKEDQAVVDRLSDVAGPLRPKEQFASYLSAYPLPSAAYYVIARTWQDLSVPRAGCVLTKSVLIDMDVWSFRPPLATILSLLDSVEPPTEIDAVRIEFEEKAEAFFPPATNFGASELIEALFLEETKPVVVFDAPDPELVALRLLAALWPDIRRRFSLSTFSLSPRKLRGRDLDLVFAPLNAQSKFVDWPGRRVDGRLAQNARHRWTEAIARRVFQDPIPKLLSNNEIKLLGERDADSVAGLRIALLWEELLAKLEESPTAALGLLDIANSGLVCNSVAAKLLEPRLAEATHSVVDRLSPNDAWDFVGAIVRKMHGHEMQEGRIAAEKLALLLSERAPEGAVSLLGQPDPNGAIDELTPSISVGLGKSEAPRVELALAEAPTDVVARLISQGGMLTNRIAQNEALFERIRSVLDDVSDELASKVSKTLLPLIVDDRQISVAKPIFDRLSPEEVAAELCRLGDTNNFQSERLVDALIDRAHEVNALPEAREALISGMPSPRRDLFLERTVSPNRKDVLWLLGEKRLPEATAGGLLVGVLRRADDRAFEKLFSDRRICKQLIGRLPDYAIDLLVRAALSDNLPLNNRVQIIEFVITQVNDAQKTEIAQHMIGICLRKQFEGNECEFLSLLLEILGSQLDAISAIKSGLGSDCNAIIASRNLVVFDSAVPKARARIVKASVEIARVLHDRHPFDLSELASDACARLMLDAEKTSPKALSEAASWLVPSLLKALKQPVSRLVSVLFPVIYRELAVEDNVPEFLKLVPFFDWDRRQTARQELVEAFMSSSWHPGDLALAAYRCGETNLFFKQVAKSYAGKKYLAKIDKDLGRLSDHEPHLDMAMIAVIHSMLSNFLNDE